MGRGRGAAEKRVGTGREDWVGAETRLGGGWGRGWGRPGQRGRRAEGRGAEGGEKELEAEVFRAGGLPVAQAGHG